MEKKTRSIQRMITILLVLAVLIMALPMTVMAKGKGKANAYGQSKIKTAEEDELEPIEEEEDSSRAAFIADRNRWAKKVAGIPPGHANLLYKYMIAASLVNGETLVFSADIPDIAGEEGSDPTKLAGQPFSFEHMQLYLENSLVASFFNADEGTLNVKELMLAIKSFKLSLPLDGEIGDEVAEVTEA